MAEQTKTRIRPSEKQETSEEVVENRLAVAHADRRVAAVCLATDPPLRGVAAFHCQQAVEKLDRFFGDPVLRLIRAAEGIDVRVFPH